MITDAPVQQIIRLEEITFCKYQLKTINKEITLSFPQLLQLRKNVQRLTAHHTLCEIIDTDNFVLLCVADKQHLIYLDIPQLLYLGEEVESFFSNSKPVLV